MATGQYTQFPIDWKSLDASQVPYSNTSSGMTATDVQNAIDELNTDLNAIDASDVPYDNTESGLTADNVQEALDELDVEKQDVLTAGDGITISSDTISTDNDATLTSAVKPAQAKAVGDALATKADSDGYYEDLTAGTANAVLGTPTKESVPYLFRRSASIGVRESDTIIGGTVAWNQLVPDGTASSSLYTVSFSVDSNNVWSVTGTPNDTGWITNNAKKVSFIKDHIYAVVLQNPITTGAWIQWSMVGGLTNINGSTVRKAGATGDGSLQIRLANGTAWSWSSHVIVTDLTQALGSAIADYIYGLESGTAGSGIAKLKEWGFLGKDYYAYDSGSLQSVKTSAHKTTGKNFMPFNLTSAVSSGGATLTPTGDGGFIVNGTTTSATTIIVWNTESVTGGAQSTQNPNKKTVPNGTYRFTGQGNGVNFQLRGSNTENADGATVGNSSGTTVTVDDTYKYNWFRVALSAGTYNNVVVYPMLRYSDVSDATYEPYESHTYSLDSSLDLRGIPKLDGSNKLYYDGDSYASDGTVTRRVRLTTYNGSEAWSEHSSGRFYLNGLPTGFDNSQSESAFGFDYGTLNDPTAYGDYFYYGSSGLYINKANANETLAQFQTRLGSHPLRIVYFITPTTESTDPFHDPQICSPYGTEEYVDTRDVPVPVGHETEYYADPVAEIERVAVQVPVPPSANGTYRLTCVVSGGVPTYSWTS